MAKIISLFLILISSINCNIVKLSYLEGKANLINSIRPKALDIGYIFKAGDIIELINDNSLATLDMGEKGSIRLIGKTKFEIPKEHPQDENLSFAKLWFGKAWSSIKKLLAEEKFEIETPTVTAGVRGTEFQVSFDSIKNLTETIVAKGAVDLTDLNGQITKMTEGMVANVNKMTTDLINNQMTSLDSFLKAMKIPLNNSAEALKQSQELTKSIETQIQNMMQKFDSDMQNFNQNLNQQMQNMQNNLEQINQNINNDLNQQMQNMQKDIQKNVDDMLKNMPGIDGNNFDWQNSNFNNQNNSSSQ